LLFDGILTYQVVSIGIPEANPLVRQAIIEWGAAWGLLYWKLLACVHVHSWGQTSKVPSGHLFMVSL